MNNAILFCPDHRMLIYQSCSNRSCGPVDSLSLPVTGREQTAARHHQNSHQDQVNQLPVEFLVIKLQEWFEHYAHESIKYIMHALPTPQSITSRHGHNHTTVITQMPSITTPGCYSLFVVNRPLFTCRCDDRNTLLLEITDQFPEWLCHVTTVVIHCYVIINILHQLGYINLYNH